MENRDKYYLFFGWLILWKSLPLFRIMYRYLSENLEFDEEKYEVFWAIWNIDLHYFDYILYILVTFVRNHCNPLKAFTHQIRLLKYCFVIWWKLWPFSFFLLEGLTVATRFNFLWRSIYKRICIIIKEFA